MKPDYAKAASELIKKLGQQATARAQADGPAALPEPPPQLPHMVIHAPRDCVFNFHHHGPSPAPGPLDAREAPQADPATQGAAR